MVDAILRESPVSQTPVSRPRRGMKYQHLKHGLVRVVTIEDGMVVFDRPWGSEGQAYLNNRQQPLQQFRAQTVDIT